jgi:hypothetical protein
MSFRERVSPRQDSREYPVIPWIPMTTSGLSLNHAVCACGTLRGVAPLSLSLAVSFLLVSDLPYGAISSTPSSQRLHLISSSPCRALTPHPHPHPLRPCASFEPLRAPFHKCCTISRSVFTPSFASLLLCSQPPSPCEFASRCARGRIFCSWWRFGALWTCWSLLLVSISVALR